MASVSCCRRISKRMTAPEMAAFKEETFPFIGYTDPKIAVLKNQRADPFPLAADDQPHVHVEFHFVEAPVSPGVRPHNPEAFFLQLLQGGDQVRHPDYRKVESGAGGSFDHSRGNSHSPIFRDNNAEDPGGFRRSNEGTQVLRVFDAVQDEDYRMPAGGSNPFLQILPVGISGRGRDSDNPLVVFGSRQPGQRIFRVDVNGDSFLPGQFPDFTNGSPFFPRGNDNPIQRLPLRPQGLEHRIDPVNDFFRHRTKN